MTPKLKLPRSPKHLQPATRRWWRGIVQEYCLDFSALRLLTMAAECWDRSEEAQLIVVKEGVTFLDAQGRPRKHPAVNVELDAKINFARLVKQLGLPSGEDVGPVPGVRSHKGKKP